MVPSPRNTRTTTASATGRVIAQTRFETRAAPWPASAARLAADASARPKAAAHADQHQEDRAEADDQLPVLGVGRCGRGARVGVEPPGVPPPDQCTQAE